jgi:hypothetical protein
MRIDCETFIQLYVLARFGDKKFLLRMNPSVTGTRANNFMDSWFAEDYVAFVVFST